MRRLVIYTVNILIMLLLAAGCGAPTAGIATPHPDASALVGLWEQFIPMDGMPQEITLDASGSAAVDSDTAQWRLEGDDLYIRRGGREARYGYTVSGYMLTLHDVSTDTSEFYVNPVAFSAGADKNAELKGRWAAWSRFSKMDFDGEAELTNIIYTTAGRTDLLVKYAARDGILQTVDTSGNYTYNLYSFGDDGALLLAETSEYDNETRQSTAYWQTGEAPAGLYGEWKKAVATEPAGQGLPAALRLDENGKGSTAAAGGDPAFFKWEYYAGGFILIEEGETNLQYAWCSQQDGALFLGNPDVDEAWYIDKSRYRPTAGALKELEGSWKPEGESKLALVIGASGTVEITDAAGKTAKLGVAAAGGVLELKKGKDTYYMAYSLEDGTLQLYYGDQPFWQADEMPLILVRS